MHEAEIREGLRGLAELNRTMKSILFELQRLPYPPLEPMAEEKLVDTESTT